MTEEEPHDPEWGEADDLFAAAGRKPEPSDGTPDSDGETEPDASDGENVSAAADDGVPDEPDDEGDSPPITSAQSPYPDGPGPVAEDAGAAAIVPVPIPPTPPTRPPTFGYHTPPPSTPEGAPGYRAGPYPAGPPVPTQPQFGRRAPQQGPRPDADGYYPSDYYLGTDWTRVVLGGLALLVLAIALISGGFYLFDRFDPRDDEEADALPTATPIPVVPVYECAGDSQPVSESPAPSAVLIAGRTADSTWLAFRNPNAPPLQLWVRSSQVPGFDTTTVGIVSCASSPQEFPTPRGQDAPASTPSVPNTPTPSLTPQPDATPTPVPTPTAVPPTSTPVPPPTPTPAPPPPPTPEPPPPPTPPPEE